MESEFIDWAITDGGLSLSYARTLSRSLGGLRRAGTDLGAFTTPEAARAAVRPALAALAKRGKRHSLRLAQKALTHYARFLGLRDARGDLVAWELAKVPRRRLDPYLGQEVASILAAVKPGFKGLRQGAMIWLLAHTGLRKAEVWSLEVGDFDQARGAVLLRRALKHGQPRWVNVPDTAWDAGGRLQRYLEARPGVPGLLWVDAGGRPLTLGGFTSDLYELRARSGVGLNFNRWRHTRGTGPAMATDARTPS